MDVKEKILNTISDLVTDFTYYDRKEDQELTQEILEAAVRDTDIFISEMSQHFGSELIKAFEDIIKDKKSFTLWQRIK